jgi:uncharacterized protein DUF6702
MYLQIIAVILMFNEINPVSAPEHAFYISVIEIMHTSQSSEATLTVKVFSDDLRDALRTTLESEEALAEHLLCSDHTETISNYFTEHMSLHLNGNPTPLGFTTCEENGDTYQLVFAADCPREWTELEIRADFLMELFPTQSQMVHITHEGNTFTTRITAKRKSQTITFVD